MRELCPARIFSKDVRSAAWSYNTRHNEHLGFHSKTLTPGDIRTHLCEPKSMRSEGGVNGAWVSIVALPSGFDTAMIKPQSSQGADLDPGEVYPDAKPQKQVGFWSFGEANHVLSDEKADYHTSMH